MADVFADRIDIDQIPDNVGSGVYAIFAKDGEADCLPEIKLNGNVVYVGLTIDLAQRNHFKARHSGFHSPRRSFGAILKNELGLTAIPRASGRSASNYRNFRFTDEGEEKLTQWMRLHLVYSHHLCGVDEVDRLETELILALKPALNLTKWANPQGEIIKALRKICSEEAKAAWSSR